MLFCSAVATELTLELTMPDSPPARRAAGIGAVVIAACAALACEPPRAPELCGSIPQQMITVGESVTVTACFDDRGGEMLEYEVWSSDPGVATVTGSGATVNVTAVSPGNSLVTILAENAHGLKAQQSFRVLVPNRPPVAVGEIPDREVMVGDSVTVDVAARFSEPDGQALAYAATSDTTVATTSVSDALVTVVAVAKGTTTVMVTATDPGGLTATKSFRVTVPNRPPVVEGMVPAQTIEVGDSASVDLSAFFSDPDGDALIYRAVTSETAVIASAVTDSLLTVTAVAKGEATVTVTATDTEGLEATLGFGVKVPNRPPVVAGSIPARTVNVGETAAVDMSPFFSDPDRDALTFTAVTRDAAVAVAWVVGDSVMVTAIAKGTTAITVTAADTEGLTAQQDFAVTVPNRAPVAVGMIPAQTVQVDSMVTVVVTPFFSDPDGDSLAYHAASSDAGVVRVTAVGEGVTVSGVAKGEALVTVTATDTEGLAATQTFAVAVPNRPPFVARKIPAQSILRGDNVALDLTDHFGDPDGDALTFAAVSSSSRIVAASVSDGVLTLSGQARGTASVTVTARDPEGSSAEQDFEVTVIRPNNAPTVTRAISSQSLAPGQRISVELDNHFDDPDEDPLRFTAGSSDDGVATAGIAGSTLRLDAVGVGTATVTVTARDPSGESATIRFSVTVERADRPNRAPQIIARLPDRTLTPGGTLTVDLLGYFRDPDNDLLRFEASSSDEGVAVADASGSRLTVSGVSVGTTTVSVTALDPGNLSAGFSFSVTVEQRRTGNRRPTVTQGIAVQTLEVGETFGADLNGHFSDPDNDPLNFSASSSDGGVATAEVSGSRLTVSGLSEGTTTVSVTALDRGNLSAGFSFSVTVEQRRTGNRRPTVTQGIAVQTLKVGETFGADLNGHFSDPNNDPLNFSASSTNGGVATVEVSGSDLKVTAVSSGSTTISVAAEDPGGLSAALDFNVTVERPPSANRAPVLVREIPDLLWVKGRSQPVQGWHYFRDPDNDPLNFSGASSNTTVATIDQHSDQYFEVVAVSDGEATITVTAHDPGGLTADGPYLLTVANNPPQVRSTPSALTSSPGQVDSVTTNSVFEDTDGGDQLSFSTSSSNTSAATSTLEFSPIYGHYAEIRGVAAGQTTVTMTATDLGGLSAEVSFSVDVESNRPPRITNQLPDVVQVAVGDTALLVLSGYFEDPEGGDLGYSARGGARVTVEVSNDTLFVIGASTGISPVQVTAEDSGGLTAQQTFLASVTAQSSSASLWSPSSGVGGPQPASARVVSFTAPQRVRPTSALLRPPLLQRPRVPPRRIRGRGPAHFPHPAPVARSHPAPDTTRTVQYALPTPDQRHVTHPP